MVPEFQAVLAVVKGGIVSSVNGNTVLYREELCCYLFELTQWNVYVCVCVVYVLCVCVL